LKIRVIETKMTDQIIAERSEVCRHGSPLQHFGKLSKIASAIRFPCSPDAS
jgi:hypothetical protein